MKIKIRSLGNWIFFGSEAVRKAARGIILVGLDEIEIQSRNYAPIKMCQFP